MERSANKVLSIASPYARVLVQDVQGAEEVQRQKAAAKEAALLEQKVLAVSNALGTVVADTRGNVEKKQARTYEELKAEHHWRCNMLHHQPGDGLSCSKPVKLKA